MQRQEWSALIPGDAGVGAYSCRGAAPPTCVDAQRQAMRVSTTIAAVAGTDARESESLAPAAIPVLSQGYPQRLGLSETTSAQVPTETGPAGGVSREMTNSSKQCVACLLFESANAERRSIDRRRSRASTDVDRRHTDTPAQSHARRRNPMHGRVRRKSEDANVDVGTGMRFSHVRIKRFENWELRRSFMWTRGAKSS